ncbi:MAG TPA: hypothetical protein DCR81_05910 [Smithella sp.]|nr:hypothetical protein [Smithella sp.]
MCFACPPGNSPDFALAQSPAHAGGGLRGWKSRGLEAGESNVWISTSVPTGHLRQRRISNDGVIRIKQMGGTIHGTTGSYFEAKKCKEVYRRNGN